MKWFELHMNTDAKTTSKEKRTDHEIRKAFRQLLDFKKRGLKSKLFCELILKKKALLWQWCKRTPILFLSSCRPAVLHFVLEKFSSSYNCFHSKAGQWVETITLCALAPISFFQELIFCSKYLLKIPLRTFQPFFLTKYYSPISTKHTFA